MERQELHDGRDDGLKPLQSLDVNKVGTFPDLLRAMAQTAFGGRQLGEAFEVLREMWCDTDCHVVLTLSGAMTVAKQGQLVCEMIEQQMVQTVIATGALIAHGLTESIGLNHYRYDPADSDQDLYEKGYNRVYDTLEMEANLNNVERLVRGVLERETPADGTWSSARICRALGQELSRLDEGPGILRSAYENDVPVFIPALTDSEMGLDIATWANSQALAQLPDADRESLSIDEVLSVAPAYNPFLDLLDYAKQVNAAERLGIFTVGGGVPRNWAQQVGPFFDIANTRLGTSLAVPRFQYGVRICPEPVHWGGLSGCTYSEGVSWGKFVPPAEGGRFAEVYADATLVWPLLLKATLDSRGTSVTTAN